MERYKRKGLPWSSGIGTNVKGCTLSGEVMVKSKLDFVVKKCDLFGKMPISISGDNAENLDSDSFIKDRNIFAPCENAFGTYRTDLNIPLGIVKSKYTVVQNTEAFKFFDTAIGKGKAEWEYAGYFGNGSKIFVTAKLPNTMKVGNDPVDSYLVFSNSHDGSSSINIMLTPVRVFCTNCLNGAVNQANAYINIRHTKSVTNNLNLGTEVFKTALELANSTEELYNYINTIKLTDDDVKRFITKTILTDVEYKSLQSYDKENGVRKLLDRNGMTLEATNISVRKTNQIISSYEYYHQGFGQEEIMGTAWGAYNAITGYYSNVSINDGEARMNSLLYGTANKVCSRALQLTNTFNIE